MRERKDTIASLKKQEEELEKMMINAPVDGETTPKAAVEKKTDAEEAPTKEEGAVTPEPKSATDEQSPTKKEDTEDWKLRYTNLRSSRDENLIRTKQDLAHAKDSIVNLQSEITKLRQTQVQVDPLDGVFTNEDTENLGESTIAAMKKATAAATAAATKPLQEQLERERLARVESDKTSADTLRREAYDIFIGRVAQAVPDWKAINFDPAFATFMDGPDLDGRPRKTYLAAAEAQGNSAQVIRYMQEFKAATKVTTPAKEDKLADKVTPVGDAAGATQAKQPDKTAVVTRAFINKFYDDVSRGRYKGRHSEAVAIEASIDKATMEGRIR